MRGLALLGVTAALLLIPSFASADPGAGLFTDSSDCKVAKMNATFFRCQYTFTALIDSELITLDVGPWKFCLDPDDTSDTTGTATVQLRHVDGPTATDNDSHAVNGLTLDGDAANGTRRILFLGKGDYWVDVTGDPGAVNATATFEKM